VVKHKANAPTAIKKFLVGVFRFMLLRFLLLFTPASLVLSTKNMMLSHIGSGSIGTNERQTEATLDILKTSRTVQVADSTEASSSVRNLWTVVCIESSDMTLAGLGHI
jgi:hypothetical protein